MSGRNPEASERPSGRPGGRRLVVALGLAACAVAIALALLTGGETAPAPDPFYAAPSPLPAGRPGTILRSREIADPPAGTLAWKLLYLSRGHAGKPAALSAVLMIPDRAPPSDRRNVVVYAHPVLGIAPGCAPSLDRDSWAQMPGLARFLRAGAAVVVPDYEGLGTAGPHPLLVGIANGRATLDAVRAAGAFPRASASARFVVWGSSAGGHTALFAGEEAEGYAPELELAGIAAAAPLTDLRRVLEASRRTVPGQLLAAYLVASWSRVYPHVRPSELLAPGARAAVDELARRCVPADSGAIGGDAAKRAADVRVAAGQPFAAQPLRGLLARNTPGANDISVPVLITQGTRDRLVTPALARRFVRRLCAGGAQVQYRVSKRVAHRDVALKTAPYAANWIAARFAGRAARSTC